MTIFKVEVEQRHAVEFYVEAANRDHAGEIASEAAADIDADEWGISGFEDVSVREIEIDPSLDSKFAQWQGRKIVMTIAMLSQEVQMQGIWVGGAKGRWEHTLTYERDEPLPKPDPNQGSLLDTGSDIPGDNPGRPIEEGPAL